MNIKKIILIGVSVSLAILSGCTVMDKIAGMGVVKQHTSTFDNAKIVEVTPNSLYAEGSLGNVVQMGARWTSAAPDHVALVLSYHSNTMGYAPVYMNLEGIDINIDGHISSFTTGQPTDMDSSGYNTVSRTIYTTSTNAVIIPYTLLQRMVKAKDCRLRIHTSKGYEDAQFSVTHIPGGKATAITSIKDFMTRVDAIRTTSRQTTPVMSDTSSSTTQSSPNTGSAAQVLAAQRVATAQGCGDVRNYTGNEYAADCSAGTLIIRCSGDQCTPIRMKR